MIVLNDRYKLLDYAEKVGLLSIYDLIDRLLPSEQADQIAYTDGSNIYVSADLLNNLDFKDQFFILCHEMLHILYKHHEMLLSDDYPNKRLLNVCQDVVINEYLKSKLKLIPDSALSLDNLSEYLINSMIINRPLNYNGVLTTRSLYRFISSRLFDDQINELLKAFESKDLVMSDDESKNQLPNKIFNELRKVLKISDSVLSNETGAPLDQVSQMSSNVSSFGKTNDTTKKVYSIQELIKWVSNFIGNNSVVHSRSRTFTRPNRRVNTSDYVLKGYKHVKNTVPISIYLDTSGSMSQRFVTDMFSTLKGLYQTTKFTLYEFTWDVQELDLTGFPPSTGGGTNIQEVLRHIKDNSEGVSIIITDCEDTFSVKDVKKDVLIFTNDISFKSSNDKVKVAYWKL